MVILEQVSDKVLKLLYNFMIIYDLVENFKNTE